MTELNKLKRHAEKNAKQEQTSYKVLCISKTIKMITKELVKNIKKLRVCHKLLKKSEIYTIGDLMNYMDGL